MNESRVPWWVLPGLGAMILTGFFGALVASCFIGNTTLQTTMFTAQVTMAAGVVGFYFGSSSGSQRKDEIAASTAARTGAMPKADSVTIVNQPDVKP